MDNTVIRTAQISDAEELSKIYEYYVKNTAISFEYQVPSPEEFAQRIANTLKKYPYFVAVQEGVIQGYAYAGPFIRRPAYDWSAELSIYLAPDKKRQGLGRMLYEALEHALAEMGIRNLYACIAYPEPEDEYVTLNSVRFHEHMGFTLAGTFHNCGYKFQRWYHMVWMEKIIGEHKKDQTPVQPFLCSARDTDGK